MNLAHLPIIDHHAHPFHRRASFADPVSYRSWFTESTDRLVHEQHVPHNLVFRLAVKWLAKLLDCEPTADAVFAARMGQDETAWAQRLMADANIATMIVDYGLRGAHPLDHAEMQAMLPNVQIVQMPRIERVIEELILTQASFSQVIEAYRDVLENARDQGNVAFKSIAAYRTGLDLRVWSYAEAAAFFPELKALAEQQGRVRIAHKPLNDYIVELALQEANRQQMPFQFHTGFGDSDADLRVANPLHLRRVIEQYRAVPFMLLHAGWPFYRETAHFAAIYPNVWMDLSLAIPFATVGIPTMLRDVLGMAPISKVLFATDAYTMPDIYWIAARWGRWGLGKVLDEFMAEGFMAESEALQAAADLLSGNAQRLYLGHAT